MTPQDKKDLDTRIFKMIIYFVSALLIGLLIWALNTCRAQPQPHGYSKVWQPCAPVDTNTIYLDDNGLNTVGPIYNAVGCPVEVWEYVSIGEFEGHSEILK